MFTLQTVYVHMGQCILFGASLSNGILGSYHINNHHISIQLTRRFLDSKIYAPINWDNFISLLRTLAGLEMRLLQINLFSRYWGLKVLVAQWHCNRGLTLRIEQCSSILNINTDMNIQVSMPATQGYMCLLHSPS